MITKLPAAGHTQYLLQSRNVNSLPPKRLGLQLFAFVANLQFELPPLKAH
jgi:hypothetical protein